MIGNDGFLFESDHIALASLIGSDRSKKKLKAWLRERKEAFSLSDAARCLGISDAQLERDNRVRIGKILSKFGCRRIEKRLAATRFLYLPPENRALIV